MFTHWWRNYMSINNKNVSIAIKRLCSPLFHFRNFHWQSEIIRIDNSISFFLSMHLIHLQSDIIFTSYKEINCFEQHHSFNYSWIRRGFSLEQRWNSHYHYIHWLKLLLNQLQLSNFKDYIELVIMYWNRNICLKLSLILLMMQWHI